MTDSEHRKALNRLLRAWRRTLGNATTAARPPAAPAALPAPAPPGAPAEPDEPA